jgi:hypothetical protein
MLGNGGGPFPHHDLSFTGAYFLLNWSLSI